MTTSYLDLNAQLAILGKDGEIQTDKDKEAARQYFLQHVNQNTVFFHTLEEKYEYMTENGYWEPFRIPFDDAKELFKYAYSFKFRFPTFVGAYKFYTSYATRTFDTGKYLERFEDRVVVASIALTGNYNEAHALIRGILMGWFQPATPTFLNAGKAYGGEMVSCFLLRVDDNMESIGESIKHSLQLSKRGGGVALSLTDLREEGASIQNVPGASSGVVPVMKILEDSFSYANQLGARQGAGAVYLHAHHPDILKFLDTKRENADEKIRIKTLSLGVVIPNITFELAREDKDMYLFSPKDVFNEYGKPLSEIGVTRHYSKMVNNPRIHKKKINARQFFQTLAEIQFESGYPYIMFEDTANNTRQTGKKIIQSNLCTEILQSSESTLYDTDGEIFFLGKDIQCNLGSMNIDKVMEFPERISEVVYSAVNALTKVSLSSNLGIVPSIEHGNLSTRAIGLGQMGLHGYLARKHVHYGSPESLEFVHAYFASVRYHALAASVELAREIGWYEGFWDDAERIKEQLAKYERNDYSPISEAGKRLCEGLYIPDRYDWISLIEDIMEYGLANAYLLAVPPTGNISYVNGATPSIHPVTSPVEIRKEGKMGRVYYPAPHLSKDTLPYYKDAYELGYKPVIDTYAAATQHTDQGLSCTLFFKDTATTRDLNKAQIYAWKKGLKTLYYVRIRQQALEGTEVKECLSCSL
ncbi:class 1b ribonucleoside-diphosphate reductase subunit alpha [Corynebacterium pyruviciproducens]|uniref:Ribonucleoside-diphosphate reductase n=1 Tax=Corynebacterium pyruviciproducens TaxID=598660 RepID=A0AAF0YV29_9CORY|nr:class 1b ribonucleoside-diphosphate reductase subunit alpha [Corynebacterium pyruviciproducens]WOT03416.1 class 1b ribonucleoside-diphosphate reductase subunit alpha [Corynebacterium pyruviciproducens]